MSKCAPAWISAQPKNREYDLKLYVAGATPKSVAAFRNLERLCEEHLAGRYHIEIIDLMKNPQLARLDQILAVPTLVRNKPGPMRKVVGNLSDTARVLASLGLDNDFPKPSAIRKGASHD
jgi:circadian clock protein KaiB